MTDILAIQMSVLLLAGMIAGFGSGLLGVGGAFVMVPVQFSLLQWMGIDPTIAIRMSFGTSLLVILPTTVSSAITHHRNGSVHLKAGIILGITGAISSFSGAYVASRISGDLLRSLFGLVCMLLSVRMFLKSKPSAGPRTDPSNVILIAWGTGFGFVSGLVGVGGGGIMIPVMISFFGFSMHQAVGTSSVLMFFTAIAGSISYCVNGWNVDGLPAYSTGYLNWLQFGLLSLSSAPMGILGAKAAHKLASERLRSMFAVVLFFIGLKMLGVFSFF